MGKQAGTCIIFDSEFLRRIMPACAMPMAGVCSITSVVPNIIIAVSPALMTGSIWRVGRLRYIPVGRLPATAYLTPAISQSSTPASTSVPGVTELFTNRFLWILCEQPAKRDLRPSDQPASSAETGGGGLSILTFCE